MNEIKPLTGFRFLAALYVFIFHIDLPFRTPLNWIPSPLHTLVSKGQLGVTIFFILSGFVLTYSHAKEFFSGESKPLAYWRGFMMKRLSRIYPLFLTGLLLTLVLSLCINQLPPLYIPLLSATFLQTYFPPIAMQWYDGGAWSVANEIFFYLLFPATLPLLLRIRSKGMLLLLISGCAIIGTVLNIWAWRGTPFEV